VGLLAGEVLYEVPDQFVRYMNDNGQMPKKKNQNNHSDERKKPTKKASSKKTNK
jgi:hypothetical protein